MIIRSNFLYSVAPFTLNIIAIVGAATALFAALIALGQTDIKKVLAYSTVSQLGFMVAALGVGAYTTSLFHVVTHAFFKALLFLAAGSVIHAMGGEQDIRNMGGLRKKLPVTYWVFLIGTLAISGVPPFAGFFSKDEILAHVWVQNKVIFIVLALTAVLTALYMFKLLFTTFFGDFRGTHDQEHHLHESPKIMTTPLLVLAVLSTLGGLLGVPEIFGDHHLLSGFLQPLISFPGAFLNEEAGHTFEWSMIGVTLVVLSAAIYYSYQSVVGSKNMMPSSEKDFSSFQRITYNKFYVDELYDNAIVKPLRLIAAACASFFESMVIDGIVRAVNNSVHAAGSGARKVQTGNVGFYIFAMVFGILAILVYNLVIR
jgi:NADH-quinone oxidoreductase subunit L